MNEITNAAYKLAMMGLQSIRYTRNVWSGQPRTDTRSQMNTMDTFTEMRETNFLIQNGNELPGDAKLFFPGEPVIILMLVKPVTMLDLMVLADVFPSKSAVRREWLNLSKKLGLSADSFEVPLGWSDFQGIGKLKHRITVLNPKPTPRVHHSQNVDFWFDDMEL